jgi:mevalonate kinase
MTTKKGSAPGKIILAGEYAVVFGYPGIAIPVAMRTEALWEDTGDAPMTIKLKGELGDESYARKIVELCTRKGGPATGTLTITNSVPVGKGMGSSTSIVIAICKCLLGDKRDEALSVEDIVNVGHSGLDFAVIWDERPTTFKKGTPPKAVELKLDVLQNAVLIDTGVPLETTTELVSHVRIHEADLQSALLRIAKCTQCLLDGESPMEIFPDHHKAQVELGVVPERVQNLIREIERNDGAAKVVGAGGMKAGAGMVLALHPAPAIPKKLAEKFIMPCVQLSF